MSRRLEIAEQRKRGAATRQYNDINILIKTPKRKRKSNSWIPVSKDTGALITEELSQRSHRINYYQDEAEEINEEDIDEEYEFNEVERRELQELEIIDKSHENIEVEPVKKMKKVKKVEKLGKSNKKVNKDNKVNKVKKVNKEKDKQSKIKLKQAQQPIESDISDDDDLEEDEVPVDLNTIRINRLPTTSNRLTSIDVLIHLLEHYKSNNSNKEEESFYEQSILDLKELLDLNLLNNEYIHNLKDLKNEKSDLRSELFNVKQLINDNLQELENIRFKYNQIQKKLKLKKIINKQINKSKSIKNNDKSKDKELWQKLNELNKIFDPNWGLLNKLKSINEKLYELDKQL